MQKNDLQILSLILGFILLQRNNEYDFSKCHLTLSPNKCIFKIPWCSLGGNTVSSDEQEEFHKIFMKKMTFQSTLSKHSSLISVSTSSYPLSPHTAELRGLVHIHRPHLLTLHLFLDPLCLISVSEASVAKVNRAQQVKGKEIVSQELSAALAYLAHPFQNVLSLISVNTMASFILL